MDNKIKYYVDALASNTAKICELKVPVDLDAAVKSLGGEVVQINENYSAVEKTGNRSFKIYIKHSDNPETLRYRTAEALGHLFLHMDFLLDSDVWKKLDTRKAFTFQNSEQTDQAKYFAKCLLIPREEYLKYKNAGKPLNEMASLFKVSLPFMEDRAKDTVFAR